MIAVRHKRDVPRVYAVVAHSAEAALAQLNGLTIDGMGIEVVGALSRDLTRRLGLKAGEMQLISTH
ncbi:RNA recognition motif domain-containing protein [Methylobacterium sp. J-068]|uniref:RNA recognition motif domain-containing protein n=1 Tax=Methylobacterium sp. J-068 TaxID=2836649 RepID=UPI001FB9EDB9|nr:RNA-binding protein [Methylobacterium sp. J-068]